MSCDNTNAPKSINPIKRANARVLNSANVLSNIVVGGQTVNRQPPLLQHTEQHYRIPPRPQIGLELVTGHAMTEAHEIPTKKYT